MSDQDLTFERDDLGEEEQKGLNMLQNNVDMINDGQSDSSMEDKEEVWNQIKEEIEDSKIDDKQCLRQMGNGQLGVVAIRSRNDDIEQPSIYHIMNQKEKREYQIELDQKI